MTSTTQHTPTVSAIDCARGCPVRGILERDAITDRLTIAELVAALREDCRDDESFNGSHKYAGNRPRRARQGASVTFHRQQVQLLRMSAAERSEELMREVRVRLGQAYLCECRGEDELAQQYGAVAGNKAALAVRLGQNVIPMVQA